MRTDMIFIIYKYQTNLGGQIAPWYSEVRCLMKWEVWTDEWMARGSPDTLDLQQKKVPRVISDGSL